MAVKILWVDDEIEVLKAQIIFLEGKGYEVEKVTNGYDALEHIKEHSVDVVLLDESMPGMTGLETLSAIREVNQNLPVVMVTKNEEENIMEEAIGSQITDYLIKPVNPNQVLLSLKKIINTKDLVSEQTTRGYMMDLRNLMMTMQSNPNYEEWVELYKKFVFWELEIQNSGNTDMMEVYQTQKDEANNEWCKFVEKNYRDWIGGTDDGPIFSYQMFDKFMRPHLESDKPVFFLLIDNLRYDQWKIIENTFSESFRTKEEKMLCSILPTTTQYSRNAIFSGLMPDDIKKEFPNEWKDDAERGGKNLYEEKFLSYQLGQLGYSGMKHSYTKVTNHEKGEELVNNIHNLLQNKLNVIVYNFVDMLSHARTELEVLKELANDEVSYRSLTKSWFEHSPLHQAMKKIADKDITVIVTTDHGTIRVKNAHKVKGDKDATTNIRYKNGKNLDYDTKEVSYLGTPEALRLPKPNLNSSYIFAKYDGYLCYPNNYNHYVKYFKNTFQHGGISLEEMLIPFVVMESK
jgi:CheY-like chemotaxis protein